MVRTFSVIIVDDNANFVDMLCQYLNCHDEFLIAGVAADFFHAYNLIISKQPDVVLLDVQMPEAQALKIIDMLNASGIKKKPEFIIMGASDVESIMQHAQTLGVLYCMIKPFDFDMAVERIGTLCGQTSPYPQFQSLPLKDNNVKNEAKILEVLYALGLTPNIQGFQYLKESILYASKPGMLDELKASSVYVAVAKIYNTTPSCVERSIQYAKTLVARRKGYRERTIFNQCLNNKNKALPTNLELIKALANEMVH